MVDKTSDLPLSFLFFRSLEILMEETKGWNIEKLESKLKDEKIVFRRFDSPYVVKIAIEIQKIKDD